MNEQQVQTTAPQQTATPPAETGQVPVDEVMGLEAVANAILGQNPAVPGVTEDLDPTMALILQNQYRQETQMTARDIMDTLHEAYPDSARGDRQKFAIAFLRGRPITPAQPGVENTLVKDALDTYKASRDGYRKEIEKEQNEKPLDDLRMEPAGSGAKGSETPEINSVHDAKMAILARIRNGDA